MTGQEVIAAFMKNLTEHNYMNPTAKQMLNSAVRAASRFESIDEVIAAMKDAQTAAEREAVEEVLGSNYAGNLISDLNSSILNASAKDYDTVGNAYLNSYNDQRTTVERLIKERKAYIFLEKYCGIILEKKYWLTENDTTTYWSTVNTGNFDTGAITGADAGGLSVKTQYSIVPEKYINTYKAGSAQEIITDKRNWVVEGSSGDDTIISNAADYIQGGSGADEITINDTGATVLGGAGKDKITVSATVSDVTLADLNEEDTLTISGTFEVGSAKIEDMLLVITDKTGSRKIRLGDFETAKNATVNGTTVAQWLHAAGININSFPTSNYSDGKVKTSDGRIAIDDDYKPTPQIQQLNQQSDNQPVYSANLTSKISVDLATVDTAQAGNLTQDGVQVGLLSSSFPNVATFTRNGLTIHLLGRASTSSSSNISALTLDQLTTDERTIIAALFKWWASDCLTLNQDSYTLSFDAAHVKDIGLYFYTNQNSGTLAAVVNWSRIDGVASQLMLNVNMNYYSGISEDDMDGTSSSSGAGFLDRTLAHEFTHALMVANVQFFNVLPQFIKEGTAELTHGIDDERGNSIFSIAFDSSRLDNALNLDNSGTGETDAYSAGYMFLRYFAKAAAAQNQNAFGSISATVNPLGEGIYYINGNTTEETASVASSLPDGAIKLGTYANGVYSVEESGVHQKISGFEKVVGLTGKDSYSGGNESVTIETGAGAKIITGSGADSIKLRGQYATISTGGGNDTVKIADGSHHTIDMGEGNNVVEIENSFNYSDSIVGGTGNDSVRINGKNNTINAGAGNDSIGLYNNVGNEKNALDAGAGADKMTVGAGTDNTYKGGAGDDTISFLNFGDDTVITGNWIDGGEGADKITVYGTLNTIMCGAGDDTVNNYSSAGNVYYYSGAIGEDVLTGLTAKDTIKLASGYSWTLADEDTNYVLIRVRDKSGANVGYIGLTGNEVTEVNVEVEQSGQVIENSSGGKVTGTNLDDEITSRADNSTIEGRAGDDTIQLTGEGCEVIGGRGDDRIINNGGANVYVFMEEDFGNDTITNFKAGDKIVLGAGTTYETQAAGDKIIISTSAGKITLENVRGTFEAATNIQGGTSNPALTLDKEGDIYLIKTAAELGALATYAAANSCAGVSFKLMANLELPENFTLNGGTLDGNGKLLTNVNSDLGGTVSNLYYHGTANISGGTKTYYVSDGLTCGIEFNGKTYLAAGTNNLSADGQVFVSYVDTDGFSQYTFATPITADMINLGAGWYVVNDNVQIDKRTLNYSGSVKMILQDGKELKVVCEDCIAIADNGGTLLNIYGQTVGTGKLTATGQYGIAYNGMLNINGGTVTATGEGGHGICAFNGDININGGTVTATGNDESGICATNGSITINGGTITATGNVDGITAYNGGINLNGGTITATGNVDGYGIYAPTGTLNLSGGQVTATGTDGGIYANTINLSGGTITASNYTGTILFNENFYDTAGNAYRAGSSAPENTTLKLLGDNYIVKVPDGVTIDGATQIAGTNSYICAAGNITLTATGYEKVTKVNGADFTGIYTVTGDATLTVDGYPKIDGLSFDSTGDYYKIQNAQDLATISALTDATGLTFKLDANLAAPDNFNLHNGTLDGQNHLLTNVNAPINGTVKDLYYHGTATLSGGTKVYAIALPEGVTANGTLKFGSDTYAKAGDTITISGYSGGEITFDSGANFTISGLTYPETTEGFDATGKYQRTTTAGAQVGTDKITWAAQEVVDLFTLSGVNTSKVTVSLGKVTISRDALQSTLITLTNADGQSYALELANDVEQLSNGRPAIMTAAHLDGDNYIGTRYSDYYTQSGNTATHYAASGGDTITIARQSDITDDMIMGAIVESGSLVDGQYKVSYTATVGTAILDKLTYGEELTFGGDIEVKFAENLLDNYRMAADTSTTPEHWSGNVYTSELITRDYYKLNGGKIKHEYQLGGTTFTISGADTSKVTVDGNTVKLTADAFTDNEITLTDGTDAAVENQVDYKLSLGDLPTTGATITETKTLNNGTVNYTASGTGTYYTLLNNTATRTAQTGGEKFTLTGIKSADGVMVDNYKVTVTAQALDMTAPSPYTVKLDGDAFTLNFIANTNGTEIPATLLNGVYTSAYTPEHFTGNSKEYTFTPETGKTTFTISGISDAAKLGENVIIDGTTVKISASALKAGETEIKLTGDNYTLALGEGMAAPTSVTEPTLKEGVYTSAGETDGYTLDGNTITYSATTRKSVEFENIADEAQASNITVDGTEITIAKAAVKTDASAPLTLKTDGYTLKMGEGMSAPTEEGATLENGVYQTAGDTE
ncbi:MAG: hypothetical protein IJT47_06710, partial [Selenomonadaceae bacterium]|nr:hypothetical protein [Selenomonadaceae bacterium]